MNEPRIICLSNAFDDSYSAIRSELIAPCLSAPKRRDLYCCLEIASGREVIVLSVPPKASDRRTARFLPAVNTRFSTHQQRFCANWDAPKVRVPLSWLFYALHVLRNVRNGDIVIIDNYELVYVIAAWGVRLFRDVTFLLDYEDGKHLIDRSWPRILSWVAEIAGKPLMQAAILAHPKLALRLPESVHSEVVPGFLSPPRSAAADVKNDIVRFVYTGSLDTPRGIEMLLGALEYLPDEGWRLDITGAGPLKGRIEELIKAQKWRDRISFHGVLPKASFQKLVENAHVGLNCQLSTDPVSSVTFPSKVFSYLSAGLLVLSSRASEVPAICGNACIYCDSETPQSLARGMTKIIENLNESKCLVDLTKISAVYSEQGTAKRLKKLLFIALKKK